MKHALFLLFALGFMAGVAAEASVDRTPRPLSSKTYPEVTEGPQLEYALASLSESFEGITFPPAGWTKISLDGGPGWNRQTAGTSPVPGWTGGALTAAPGGGTAMAFATWNTGGASTNDQWLVTPQLTNVLAGDSLKFWLRYWPDSFTDTMYVIISTTGATSGDFTVPVATLGYGLTSDTNWVRYAYNLTDYVSAGSDIYIAFREKVLDNFNDGSSFSLDLVEVGAPATKDIQVLSASLSPASPSVGQAVTVSAVIVNNGSEPNPASVPVTYKVGSVPGSSGDGTAQTFIPTWTGNTDTVSFTTTYTPLVTGSLTIGVRSFYTGDLTPVNDSAKVTTDVNPPGTILSEGFTSVTFPPTGWTLSDEPTVRWSRLTATVQPNGVSGPAARYNFFSASAGEKDTLITPAVDLTGLGSVSLEFYHAKRAYTGGESDSLFVMISSDGGANWTLLFGDGDPNLSTVPAASANYTPAAIGEWELNTLPVPAPFLTSNVTIGFIALSDFGNQLWIDDVKLTEDLPMSYQTSTTTQNSALVLQGTTEQQVIGIEVVTAGALSPIDVTQLNLSTNGTTNTADISNAKVFYTGTSSTFAAINQFGTTVATPAGSFNVTGTQTLATGTNYFWLTYDIPGGATVGNVVDAECASVTVDGTPETPTVTAPAGSRLISGPMAAGDYTVGLAAFNDATGRTLRHERFTRMVTKAVPVDAMEAVVKQEGKQAETIAATASVATRLVEVEEEYWALTENGSLYTGPLVAHSSTESALGIYATITAAFADLNSRGVSGHVRFLLVDASYPSETYPLTINVTSPLAPSASATVTVKPAIGVSPSVSGSFAGPIFRIVNTNYVTLDGSNTNGGSTRDWTITNGSATSPNVIHVGSLGVTPITNTTIKNCILVNGAQTSSAVVVGSGTTVGDSGYFNTFTLENNSIQKAFIGAYIHGGTSPAKGINVSAVMNDLSTSGVNSIRRVGLYCQGVDGAVFSQNTIANFDGASSEDDRGIWFATGTINSTAARNEIYNLNYTGTGGYAGQGVVVSSARPASNNTVKNNFIYNLSGDGWNYTTILGDNNIGIFVFSVQSGVMVYNNSVSLYGNTLNQTQALSIGIAIGTGTNADIRNNVVSNSLGLLAATGYGTTGLYVQDSVLANLSASVLDNNNYFVNPTGSGASSIAKIWSSDHATLGSWQGASGQEASSIEGDPMYTSASDLHITDAGSPASNAGVALGAVTDDFDGDVRGSTPDIGADEFTGGIGTSVVTGWNIVSNPVTTANDSMKQLFPTSSFTYGFKFVTGSGYVQEYELANGAGYWAKFPGATGVAFAGSPRTSDSINVVTGWNLIGSISSPVDTGDVTTDPPGILASNFFGYPYSPLPGAIAPGKGYWIKANAPGKIYLEEAPVPAERPHAVNPLESLNRVTITDAQGGSQTLYFGTDNTGTVNAPMFAMPPVPPSDAFDARFESSDGGHMVQLHDAAAGIGASFPVRIQSVAYPLTVTWNIAGGVYDLVQSGTGKTLAGMQGEGTVQIPAANGSGVAIRLAGTDALPVAFELMQNYPNPFNPSTMIRFALPNESRVTVEIYNVLGERVRTLASDVRKAGYHTVEWNGTDSRDFVVGSGVYFVRVSANGAQGQSFVDVRKMTLMK